MAGLVPGHLLFKTFRDLMYRVGFINTVINQKTKLTFKLGFPPCTPLRSDASCELSSNLLHGKFEKPASNLIIEIFNENLSEGHCRYWRQHK